MHHNPIPGIDPVSAEQALDQALLDLLVTDHATLWSLTELSHSLTSSSQAASGDEPPSHDIEDAVERLYAAGLLHRIGQFVFASRAAHAAQRLVS